MNPTTPLTNEEIIELLGITLSNINDQFELWLTITFAVIIASYVAGHRLSTILKFSFAALYLMVSTLLLLMLSNAARLLRDAPGSADFFASADTAGTTTAIVLLRVLVWVLGTGVTLVFIFRGFRERADRCGANSESMDAPDHDI